jgi:hypothetical protein
MVGVVFGRGVALVVIERDRLLRDVEGDVAIGAIVVLPAGMGRFENVLSEAFDGGGDADGRTLRFGLAPNGFAYLDRGRGHGGVIVAGPDLDILDLAGIAIAVEADDEVGYASPRQRIEQRAFVQIELLRFELGLGGGFQLPFGERWLGFGGWCRKCGSWGSPETKAPGARAGRRVELMEKRGTAGAGP